MQQYDATDPESIETYAKRLEGKSLRTVLAEEERAGYQTGKGRFGDMVERSYFGINPGNKPTPDFDQAGVELKTTPLKHKGRKLVPKERLVLGMIDYEKVHAESWETSSFLRKNALLLIIFYLWEAGLEDLDYVVKLARLWSFPEEDAEIIRDDWEWIVAKIRDGRAHELSEGDTMYLAACTKAAKGTDRRRQPFSDIDAKPRAFSLKQSYMRSVVDESLRLQSAVDAQTLKTGVTFEQVVHERFRPYLGMTAQEFADRLQLRVKPNAKNFYALLTKRVLGVEADSKIAEFEKAGILTRTMRILPNGTPKEDVSFPAFDYFDLLEQSWDDSEWRAQLQQRFFFVIFQLDASGTPRFLRTQFWTMPVSDLETYARECWDQTVYRIRENRAEYLPRKSESPVCHVRPHGRNREDTLPTPQGVQLVKKSFWLNGTYLRDQLLSGQDS